MNNHISKNDMIEYAKKHLKERGFKKKALRWTKDMGEFTVCFFLQGSSYDKEDYYIRPGVWINAIGTDSYYGHFSTEIQQTTTEAVMTEFDEFVRIWTDKGNIKRIVDEFLVWDKRNPLEKRRAGEVDYEKDPVPSRVCFSIPQNAMKFILEHFD